MLNEIRFKGLIWKEVFVTDILDDLADNRVSRLKADFVYGGFCVSQFLMGVCEDVLKILLGLISWKATEPTPDVGPKDRLLGYHNISKIHHLDW